jgi:glycosyltransferase involved in cell wall biosynthesis
MLDEVATGLARQHRMRSLFLTYDGLLSPLGQSQILPYLRGLRGKGHRISILSFERPIVTVAARAQLRDELAGEGIAWRALRYHKAPTIAATAFDIVQGVLVARRMIRCHNIDLLHARSYVPMLMALLVAGRRKVVFDMRGFWADERIDGNLWTRTRPTHKLLHRLAKGLERWGLRRADHVVILTHAAHRVLGDIPGVAKPLPPVSVIRTCVDLARFGPAADKAVARRALGLPATPIVVYQGQVGTWYLLQEMAAFIRRAKLRWPQLLFLILAPDEHEFIRRICAAAGLVEGAEFRVEALAHGEVARWVAAADGAVFLIRPSYGKLGSCPTKLGECMACGIPVVANAGVGDVADIISEHRIGSVVSDFNDDAYDRAVDDLEALWRDPDVVRRCRNAAESGFSLTDAIVKYDAIYRSLESPQKDAAEDQHCHADP